MINYKLAKQLKEVGYKIVEILWDKSLYREWTKELNDKEWEDVFEKEWNKHKKIWSPTLSELIDAIPMRAKYLGTINDAHFVLRKLVSEDKNSYWAYMEDEDTNEPVVGYSFREEPADVVVARLWLKLKGR